MNDLGKSEPPKSYISLGSFLYILVSIFILSEYFKSLFSPFCPFSLKYETKEMNVNETRKRVSLTEFCRKCNEAELLTSGEKWKRNHRPEFFWRENAEYIIENLVLREFDFLKVEITSNFYLNVLCRKKPSVLILWIWRKWPYALKVICVGGNRPSRDIWNDWGKPFWWLKAWSLRERSIRHELPLMAR